MEKGGRNDYTLSDISWQGWCQFLLSFMVVGDFIST